MVQVILNNDLIVKDVPSSILEQIYPEELDNDPEVPLPFIKPDNFILFVDNYNKIINNEELFLDIIIISLNVSIALQLYNLTEQLKSRVILCFNDLNYLQNLKPFKNRIIEVLSELQPDISYEILSKIKQFIIDYEINNVDIDRASLNLSIAVNAIDNYKFNIYRDGILDRTRYDDYFSKELIIDFRKIIGIEFNGDIILAPLERSLIARDGSKYLKWEDSRGYKTLYYINGDVIKDNIKNNIRAFSHNLNYVVHTNFRSSNDYWSEVNDIYTNNFWITNVHTLSTIHVTLPYIAKYRYSFSPDEKYIVVYSEYEALIYDVINGEKINEVLSTKEFYFDIALISNSGIFIYMNGKDILYLPFTESDLNNAILVFPYSKYKQKDDSDLNFPNDYYEKNISESDIMSGLNDSLGLNLNINDDKRFIVFRYLPTYDNITLVEAIDKLIT